MYRRLRRERLNKSLWEETTHIVTVIQAASWKVSNGSHLLFVLRHSTNNQQIKTKQVSKVACGLAELRRNMNIYGPIHVQRLHHSVINSLSVIPRQNFFATRKKEDAVEGWQWPNLAKGMWKESRKFAAAARSQCNWLPKFNEFHLAFVSFFSGWSDTTTTCLHRRHSPTLLLRSFPGKA